MNTGVMIGSGQFAKVYDHPRDKNKVIKKVSNKHEMDILWLQFCKKNWKRCASIPRVFSIQKRGRYTYAKMEKLKMLNADDFTYHQSRKIRGQFNFFENVVDNLKYENDFYFNKGHIKKWKYLTICSLVRKFYNHVTRTTNCKPISDVSDSNILLRKDKSGNYKLVLTDIFYEGNYY